MSRRPFRVGRSRTGLGLFATQPIKKNTRIAEYKGPLLTGKAAEKAEASGNRYLYEVNKRWTIDGKARSNLARYGNHSCNPNADSYNVKRRVFIRTIKNIKPGDEITYDYGIDYLKNVIGKSKCQCTRCRKRRAKRAAENRVKRLRKAARLARQGGKVPGQVPGKVATKRAARKSAKSKSSSTKSSSRKSPVRRTAQHAGKA